jgi:hypothetical protein
MRTHYWNKEKNSYGVNYKFKRCGDEADYHNKWCDCKDKWTDTDGNNYNGCDLNSKHPTNKRHWCQTKGSVCKKKDLDDKDIYGWKYCIPECYDEDKNISLATHYYDLTSKTCKKRKTCNDCPPKHRLVPNDYLAKDNECVYDKKLEDPKFSHLSCDKIKEDSTINLQKANECNALKTLPDFESSTDPNCKKIAKEHHKLLKCKSFTSGSDNFNNNNCDVTICNSYKIDSKEYNDKGCKTILCNSFDKDKDLEKIKDYKCLETFSNTCTTCSNCAETFSNTCTELTKGKTIENFSMCGTGKNTCTVCCSNCVTAMYFIEPAVKIAYKLLIEKEGFKQILKSLISGFFMGFIEGMAMQITKSDESAIENGIGNTLDSIFPGMDKGGHLKCAISKGIKCVIEAIKSLALTEAVKKARDYNKTRSTSGSKKKRRKPTRKQRKASSKKSGNYIMVLVHKFALCLILSFTRLMVMELTKCPSYYDCKVTSSLAKALFRELEKMIENVDKFFKGVGNELVIFGENVAAAWEEAGHGISTHYHNIKEDISHKASTAYSGITHGVSEEYAKFKDSEVGGAVVSGAEQGASDLKDAGCEVMPWMPDC